MTPRRQIDRQEVEQWSTSVKHHFWVRVIFSSLLLLAALYVLLSRSYGSETEKWATGAIGLVVGYWLNNRSTKA